LGDNPSEVTPGADSRSQEGSGFASGRYRVLREIGRGGQAVVYEAEDSLLGRRIALKVLEVVGPASQELFSRFAREAAVTARLQHPNICVVHDTGMEQGVPFIAMQLVEGESLDRRIHVEPGRLPGSWAGVASTLHLIEKSARALAAAHEAGIIHRDIKPSNIMVTPAGEPILLDFGLARGEDRSSPTLTMSGDIMGTPAYMSPEQISGRTRTDRRTDIYSLGVVLYECLTLRRPFEAPTREGLFFDILTREAPDGRRINPAIPRDVRVVIEKCLEKDRDSRYETALDLAEDLRRARVREPVRARPVRWWTRQVRWLQRNPALGTALLALIAVLSVATATLKAALDSAGENTRRREEIFSRYQQAADPALLRHLEVEVRALWPAREELVPRMDAWLDQARALELRVPDRLADLESLKRRARPRTAADFEEEERLRRDRHPRLFHDLHVKERELARLAKPVGGEVPEEQPREMGGLETLRSEIQALRSDPRMSERLIWRFADAGEERLVESLREFARGVARLPDQIREIEQRRAFALEVRRLSIENERDAWSVCLKDLAASERYDQLEMSPQIGLVPRGKDRDSGLWEFWVLGSGERPRWQGDLLSGRGAAPTEEDALAMVLLPGGACHVGAQRSRPGDLHHDPSARPNEAPVHRVLLEPLFLSKYEMTRAQWLRLMGPNANLEFAKGDMPAGLPVTERNPMTNITWEAALEACTRLGLGLPTEAQWEYASRAGKATRWWTGDDVRSLQGAANVADAFARRKGAAFDCSLEIDDGNLSHAPVGTFRPNPFGLHDMVGNVWEWCHDGLAEYGSAPRAGDGLRIGEETRRVYRGGSFSMPAGFARVSQRGFLPASAQDGTIGVRPSRRVLR